MTSIKVGFCVAYDWHLLAYSLPPVYKEADAIYLSIDKDRVSWSNQSFSWNEIEFRALIESVDVAKKIFIIEEDFHKSNLTPMQNEVRQRNIMAEKMGSGGWHIQLDCDEYFVGFGNFVRLLKRLKKPYPVNVCCKWITLFKKVSEGFLYIAPGEKRSLEFIPIATRHPVYEYGRRNGHFNHYTNFEIVHQSWARDEREVVEKLNNWGHKNDFNTGEYVSLWRSLNHQNFGQLRDFHPIEPTIWSSVDFVKGKSIEEVIANLQCRNILSLNKWDLLMKNSRLMAKLKSLIKV